MTFSLSTLFVCAIAYLLLLFLIAYATEQRWLPQRLIHHPLTYVLSLGVYATAWTYYGSVGFADRAGLSFLAIYLGVSLVFVLTPVLLLPLLRLTRTYQLTSAADVFAFRFDSQLAGVLVTLAMLTGSLPYIALQIRAVAESTQVLSGHTSSPIPIAVGFCVLVSVFAIIFGARHVTAREKHSGLVAAIAFESLVKLVALITVTIVAVKIAFGGPAGLSDWLSANPEALQRFYAPVNGEAWGGLLFITFAAAFMLPRQFHMIFTENLRPRSLLTASWGFPLLLLLLSVAAPPILWAGYQLAPDTVPDYYVLGISMLSGSPLLALFAYAGGISAASAMIIVCTLALSSMTLNHLVLPLVHLSPRRDLYHALRWARRTIIAIIIAAGYLFFTLLEQTQGLVSWGLISFLAMAQLMPGIIGVLYWQRATRTGFIVGLSAGVAIWAATALVPALAGVDIVRIAGITFRDVQGASHYADVAFWSVAANAALFTLASLLTAPTEREQEAAMACHDISTRVPRGALLAESPTQFTEQLAPLTGHAVARSEVGKALADLDMGWGESRPDRLQQLREQIERNLSGMMGPILARLIVDERLRLDTDMRTALAHNVSLIEERLEGSGRRFRGLAAELDELRRYHRQILEDLPLGVVAVTPYRRIVRWNPAMQSLTGLASARVIGRRVDELPAPWGGFLIAFLKESVNHAHKRRLRLGTDTRWLSLHKAFIGTAGRSDSGDRLLLVEDVTELQRLEEGLTHSERLASIGRLAAGVAHEIGNPITGIACLAQELRDTDECGSDISDSAQQILEQTRRISTIVQTLVSYAHAGAHEGQRLLPVRVAEVVAEAERVVRLGKRARSLTFSNRVAPDFQVMGDYQRLIQVFVNLFTNAVDACNSDGGGHVEITAQRRQGRMMVCVSDNGPGVPPSFRDKILEPFFTTKEPGQGTGLGLPLIYSIVREHNGELDIRSRHGDIPGTDVFITLPEAGAAQADH